MHVFALSVVESQNEYLLYVPKLEVENYISDRKNKEVKVKQLYKDKSILVSVMAKYILEHTFNFRARDSIN